MRQAESFERTDTAGGDPPTVERRSGRDRRVGLGRRTRVRRLRSIPVAYDRREQEDRRSGFQRRSGVDRRDDEPEE